MERVLVTSIPSCFQSRRCSQSA